MAAGLEPGDEKDAGSAESFSASEDLAESSADEKGSSDSDAASSEDEKGSSDSDASDSETASRPPDRSTLAGGIFWCTYAI